AAAVQVAAHMNRRHPVGHHTLLASLAGVGPHFLVPAARLQLQKRATDLVALGDEDLVADDDRVAGVDALDKFRPPPVVEVHFPGARLHRQQPAARKEQAQAALADGDDDRRGVAGEFVADLVLDLARVLVERHQGGAVAADVLDGFVAVPRRAATDLYQEQVALDERRAADAEEVLHDAELLVRVDLPGRLAVRHAHAVEHAFGAEDVDAVAVHDRRAAWPAVVVVHVAVVGGVLEGPQRLGGLGLPAAQPAAVADTVEEEEPAPADGRHRVADADVLVPEDLRPALGPDDALLGRDAVVARAKEAG